MRTFVLGSTIGAPGDSTPLDDPQRPGDRLFAGTRSQGVRSDALGMRLPPRLEGRGKRALTQRATMSVIRCCDLG